MDTDNTADSIQNRCSVPELRNPGRATALDSVVQRLSGSVGS